MSDDVFKTCLMMCIKHVRLRFIKVTYVQMLARVLYISPDKTTGKQFSQEKSLS
jgi:hypothetical protein